jgi:hypothetical protein
MVEQPVPQSTTHALGGTTVVFGWVEEARVQEVLHASDGFQMLLAVTLAGAGAAAASGVTLAAGVTHPGTLYLILAVAVTITVVIGAFCAREYLRYRSVRRTLGAVTARVPVPVLLVTPGTPSFTVGGQQPFAVGGQLPFSAPSTAATSASGPSAMTATPQAATAPIAPEQETRHMSASSEASLPEEIAPADTKEKSETAD